MNRKPYIGATVLYWRAADADPLPLTVTKVHGESDTIDGGSLCLMAGWESRLNVQYGPQKQSHWGWPADSLNLKD